jgi:flagellar operon protein
MDSDEFLKIKDAISKLKSKGGKDSLVITNSAAYIVDVNNNKIVTAIDKNKMSENVFTKIDSTLFVN